MPLFLIHVDHKPLNKNASLKLIDKCLRYSVFKKTKHGFPVYL